MFFFASDNVSGYFIQLHGDNELVLQHEGLEVLFSYVKQQYEGSEVKLRNIFTGFMDTSLGSYQKHISGSMMTTIDAAAELLRQLGVQFDESDWNIYKHNMVQSLICLRAENRRHSLEADDSYNSLNASSQPSQPKRLRSSLSIRSTLGSELHDGEEQQQNTQTLDDETIDVDDFGETQQSHQQPQHETVLTLRRENVKLKKALEKQSRLIRTLQKHKKQLQQKVRRMQDNAKKPGESRKCDEQTKGRCQFKFSCKSNKCKTKIMANSTGNSGNRSAKKHWKCGMFLAGSYHIAGYIRLYSFKV